MPNYDIPDSRVRFSECVHRLEFSVRRLNRSSGNVARSLYIENILGENRGVRVGLRLCQIDPKSDRFVS